MLRIPTTVGGVINQWFDYWIYGDFAMATTESALPILLKCAEASSVRLRLSFASGIRFFRPHACFRRKSDQILGKFNVLVQLFNLICGDAAWTAKLYVDRDADIYI